MALESSIFVAGKPLPREVGVKLMTLRCKWEGGMEMKVEDPPFYGGLTAETILT